MRQTSLDLVGEQRKWLEKDDKEGTKHQVKETFSFFFQIPIIPISSQANPADEQDSHNQEERDEKKPEDTVSQSVSP